MNLLEILWMHGRKLMLVAFSTSTPIRFGKVTYLDNEFFQNIADLSKRGEANFTNHAYKVLIRTCGTGDVDVILGPLVISVIVSKDKKEA